METWRNGDKDMETWRHGHEILMFYTKTLTENRKQKPRQFFLNPITVCLSCKRKFVICLFIDEETKGSYPFANGLGD
jgi:hypothetical protein